MKEFSLEEYLKNPDREVVTRDGKNVRIICTDRKNHDSQPIIALVEGDEDDERVRSYKIDGKWSVDELESSFDLFFAPEKHEGWINIYADINNNSHPGNHIFKSKEEAEEDGEKGSGYVTTIKIEWEK